MSTSESFDALRRANPRSDADFAEAVDQAAAEIRQRIATAVSDAPRAGRVRRRRLLGVAAVGAAAVAVSAAAVLAVGSSGVPGVESAAAAIKKAATVTAASARQSGTATVQMTHDGQLWAHKVIHWNGDDVEITDDSPGRPSGNRLLLVNGTMYGRGDPEYDWWVELGSPSSIDPGSGMTPAEYLAALRQDVRGDTVTRIVAAMTPHLTKSENADGSTVYSGKVAAGEIARETGIKEGQSIRVFPFGYVAHDAAADPASLLDTTVTVDTGGAIREIAVAWGTWTYTVTYSALGATAAPVVPAHAKSLRELRQLPPQQ